jgi:Dolichyl-phosphate-mannose-protein mannosyltransferase
MSAKDSMKGERIGRATLLLVLFTAAGLRLSAVGFGNHSLTFQPDEDSNVPLALTLSWADLNPHAFYYPAFLWYMLFAMDRLVFWFGKQYGLLRHWQDLQRLFAENPLPFFFLSRTLSVAFGTATVGLVYLLGRRLFSPAHGLLAAGFLAVTFLHVRDSALATPDAPMTFFVVLSLLGTAAVLAQGRVRDHVLAAGAAGLATATKYNAVLVIVALIVAHGLRVTRTGQPRHRIVMAQRLLGALLFAALIFFALNPYFLLDGPKALRGLMWQWAYQQRGQYLDIGPGWRYHFTVSLRYGMGLGLLGLAFAGMVRALWRRQDQGLVLLSFAASFYLVMGSARAIFVRYMTPLLPILCLFAAAALLSLTELLKWPRARPWVAAGLGLLAVVEPLAASAAYDRMVHQVDTRVQTREFILASLPPGTKVATYGPSVTWRSTFPRFLPVMYAKHREQSWAEVLTVLKAKRIQYFLTHHSGLDVFSPTIPELQLAVHQSGTLIREFSPYEARALPHPVYDRVDAHYFPIGGFRGVMRPGPLVRLYRLE